jgi:hypothetical protein
LKAIISDKDNKFYHSVYICGVSIAFSPEIIADIFGVPHYANVDGLEANVQLFENCKALTDGVVTTWPDGGYLKSSSLTGLYFALYKL